eukprot:6114520-Lingulodinium_polyedra.AAC.1
MAPARHAHGRRQRGRATKRPPDSAERGGQEGALQLREEEGAGGREVTPAQASRRASNCWRPPR